MCVIVIETRRIGLLDTMRVIVVATDLYGVKITWLYVLKCASVCRKPSSCGKNFGLVIGARRTFGSVKNSTFQPRG